MDTPQKSHLSADLKNLLILLVVIAAIVVGLYSLDVKTNYLDALASKLMSGIK